MPEAMSVVRTTVLVPVFNDWESLERLLAEIDAVAGELAGALSVIVVNDGSTRPLHDQVAQRLALTHVRSLEVIDLVCNLGHQRAIAIGLSEIVKRDDSDTIIIMDGDGEDDPRYIPELLACHAQDPTRIVLAERHRRSEGAVFRLGYRLYKLVFRLLTGRVISFGNYSLLPVAAARAIAYMPNLWNSLPATILQSRFSRAYIPTVRAKRYHGQSNMNFTSLVTHGLFSISVFSETVPIRIALVVGMASVALATGVVLLRLFTEVAVLGWASFMVGLLAIIFTQALFVLLTSSLLILQNRTTMHIVPALYASQYVAGVRRLWPADA